MTLYGRSFLTLLDYTPDEIRHLLDLAKRLKREKHLRIGHRHLMGRNIVLLFEKTRTRCAFEVAGRDLGMGVTAPRPGQLADGQKRASRTQRACWAACTTVSNTAVSAKYGGTFGKVLRRCRCGTA